MRNFLKSRTAYMLYTTASAVVFALIAAACSPIAKGVVANAPELTAVAQNPSVGATSSEFVIGWILYGTPTPRPTLDSIDILTATAAAQQAPAVVTSNPTAVPASNSNAGDVKVESGDPARGELVFQGAGTCASCHDTSANITVVGPSLVGMGTRAGTRKPDMSADDYLHEAIMDPNVFLVEGFAPVMPQNFAQVLTPQQIADLIAYLKSLK
jgi:cytochrome c2